MTRTLALSAAVAITRLGAAHAEIQTANAEPENTRSRQVRRAEARAGVVHLIEADTYHEPRAVRSDQQANRTDDCCRGTNNLLGASFYLSS